MSNTFFLFEQNNSGGYLIENDWVRSCVIIEASDAQSAYLRLDEMDGVTMGGCEIDTGIHEWCECCGPRWTIERNGFLGEFSDLEMAIGKVTDLIVKRWMGTTKIDDPMLQHIPVWGADGCISLHQLNFNDARTTTS